MYLAPDGDEIAIADAAAGFLAEAMPIARLHERDPADLNAALRVLLGDMGWFALAVPEAVGGSGLSAVEHTLFFREAGRQCGPVDLLAQCLAANVAGDPELRRAIMGGTTGVALAVADAGGYRIFGAIDAEFAVLVTPDQASLYALAGVQTEPRPALDPANSIRIAATLPPPAATVAGPAVWQLGQLGAAAMLVGIAEAALDQIVEYAKVRETFGRKIGSWQAVRHPCADMAVRAEAARSELWYAATAIKEGRPDAQVHLDAAKHLANQAAHANADTNIQLHGGIGVTDEHHAHLLLKHSMLLSRLFGSKRALLARLLHARLDD
jgi:alkylation response protein AidB-like acyl-CoA dehydrogenase